MSSRLVADGAIAVLAFWTAFFVLAIVAVFALALFVGGGLP